jgi:type IV secretory pathway VirJ component
MSRFTPLRSGVAILALVAAACHQPQIPELPLVEMPPSRPGAPLAIIVSGDGGWRALDRGIAKGLHKRGYAVVGLNSRAYFAKRRSPQEASLTLERIIDHYTRAWHTDDVVAVGYSRGAGVLPFMINRLPPDIRARISVAALIGLDRTIDFYVTPFDLLRTEATSAEVPVRGEVEKLHGIEVLCIFGQHDEHNLCGDLPDSVVVHVPEPGGHHMNISHDLLAQTIAEHAAGRQKAEGRKQK